MPVTLEEFATDACPIDSGGFFRGDWFYRNWEIDHPNLAKAHINLKETFTVLLTLCRWKSHLRDKWIVVHSNNHMTISALKEHVAIHKSCNGFVISFGFPALTNFRITARYILSKANTMADALSRLHDPAFGRVFNTHFCRLLVENDSYRHHLSQQAFSSLPLQVQSMLKSSYFRTN